MIEVIEQARIQLEPLVFDLNDKDSDKMLIERLNIVPVIYIHKIKDPYTPVVSGSTISPEDIFYIKLYNSYFLPEIEIYTNSSNNMLFSNFFPNDHDTIISFFSKAPEDVKPVRMDFMVTEFQSTKSSDLEAQKKFLIKGVLNVDKLYFNKFEAYSGTSYNVIKDLAVSMDLGFATNVVERDSNDSMKWLNPGENRISFINNITKCAFISEESFIWTFIDFYYNVNYIDIQFEMNNVIKKEVQNVDDQNLEIDMKTKNILLYLSNNKAIQNTNLYFTKFILTNNSFKNYLENSYSITPTWHNKSTNSIEEKVLKPLYTDEQQIGAKLFELTDKSSELYNESNNKIFMGSFDTNDNVHPNYMLAKALNKFNIINMEKLEMVLTLEKVNYSIKRFQSIRVEIYEENDLFTLDADKKTAGTNINKKLSGFWFVTGINYVFKKNNGLEQEITLVKRDLNVEYGILDDEKNDIRKYIESYK